MNQNYSGGLNDRCTAILFRQGSEWSELGIETIDAYGGARVFDFGTSQFGSIAGGCLLARLCMADLGTVSVGMSSSDPLGVPEVQVQTDHPFLACMAAQYAGWPVASGKYFAMGSGPARILRQKEELFQRFPVSDSTDSEAWLVLESARVPNEDTIRMIANECGVSSAKLRICVSRTASLPGTVQIVARSIETTMHKLFELTFDLRTIVSAMGTAPLPPIGNDDLQAIGWTNDAILYGSRVWLCVDCEQQAVDGILDQIPSCSSADYGKPFREIFERYNRDFYAIDRMLFSPAQVTIHNLRTGRTVRAGERRNDVLTDSFGLASVSN